MKLEEQFDKLIPIEFGGEMNPLLRDGCVELSDNHAIGFSEWLQENRWYSFIQGKWNYTFEQGTSISEANYNKNYRKTTKQLLEIYKKTL